MNRKERRAERKRSGSAPRAIQPDHQQEFAFAIELHQAGRLIEALPYYRAVLRNLHAGDRSATTAVALRAKLAAVQYNYGSALQGLGRTDEALAAYGAALIHDPAFAAAHYNIATAKQGLGDVGEAIAAYRRALACRPDFVEAQYNLAVLLTHREPDAAIEAYRRILASNPDFPAATRNLALLLSRRGDHASAANMLIGCLKAEETSDFKAAFVEIFEHVRWTRDDEAARNLYQAALTEPWGRPHKLVRSAVSLLMLDPSIAACVAGAEVIGPEGPTRNLLTTFEFGQAAADPLLTALLVSAPICDIGFERLLTLARRGLLGIASETSTSPLTDAALRFFCALAQQCFVNEYAYARTEGELQDAVALCNAINGALERGAQIPVHWLVAAATFHPLSSLPLADRLLQGPWPKPVLDLLVQQVVEPAREAIDCEGVARLTDIDDPISLLVRDQYEESPYPRWAKIAPLGSPRTIAGFLAENLPAADRSAFQTADGVRVLIAGCGTGQHAIETAWRFADSRVTAIDISLNSLAYAGRKTRELGLQSIEYLQADLLRLEPGDLPFDMIESVGTLHHMADPWAGWRALIRLLRPGGVMKIGLYSESGRRSVDRARRVIAERGWGSTPDEIRRARQELVELEARGELENITTSDDFFALSGCRDLFFHVQEHRFTLSGIENFLRANGLTFLGFESLGAGVSDAYRRRFVDDPTGVNLAQWQVLENDNPDSFPVMYQFWVQKRRNDENT